MLGYDEIQIFTPKFLGKLQNDLCTTLNAYLLNRFLLIRRKCRHKIDITVFENGQRDSHKNIVTVDCLYGGER